MIHLELIALVVCILMLGYELVFHTDWQRQVNDPAHGVPQ